MRFGTYALRVAAADDAGTTLYSAPSVVFADCSDTGLYWIGDATGHGTLLQCDLTQTAATARVTCAEPARERRRRGHEDARESPQGQSVTPKSNASTVSSSKCGTRSRERRES